MAEFPSKVSTRTSSPAQGAGASVSSLRPDLGFVRSSLGALMLLQLVSARGAAGPRVGYRRGLGGRSGAPGGPPSHPVHPQPRLTRAPTRRAYPRGASRTDAPEITLAPSHLESPCCGPCEHTRHAQVFRAHSNAPPSPQVVTRGPHRKSRMSHGLSTLSWMCLGL